MVRKNGDWTIRKTEKVFSNDFFEVFEDQVIQPDGKNGSYATIKFKAGVAVLLLDDAENIYLTKQFRYAIEREDLEVAAGVVEGESYLEAAKREAAEELGIEAQEWTDFGVIQENTSITKSVIKLFLAQKLTFSEPKPEGTEKIEIVKMPLEEALRKVMQGEITHDLTCLLIMKTSLYLKGN
jgi:8-oxo-dGTP pyrophosphatase MutT (NUDIX family)